MDAEQFYAASLQIQRETLAATLRVAEALDEVRAHAQAHEREMTTHAHGPAQLELVVRNNGHAPAAARRDPFGQELPRGVSWDASGAVWAVGATNRDRGRLRVRVPAARFSGDHAGGLAEARRVLAFLTDSNGRDARGLLAAMHPDTARDVAEVMAR